jgi:hypothetical protein
LTIRYELSAHPDRGGEFGGGEGEAKLGDEAFALEEPAKLSPGHGVRSVYTALENQQAPAAH